MADANVNILIKARDAATSALTKVKVGLLAVVAAVAGVAAAFAGLTKIIKDLVETANIQEKSEIKLAQALRTLGRNTKETREELFKYASELQTLTTDTDETIIEVQALLAGLGRLHGDALKRATKATLDFSRMLGIDLRGAAINVAKAATGFTSALTRYIGKVELTGDVNEDFLRVLGKMENATKGLSEALTQTLGGRMLQASNSMGDFKEKLGSVVSEAEGMHEIFILLRKTIDDFSDSIERDTPALVRVMNDLVPVLLFVAEGWTKVAKAMAIYASFALAAASASEFPGLEGLQRAFGTVAGSVGRLAGDLEILDRRIDELQGEDFGQIKPGEELGEGVDDTNVKLEKMRQALLDLGGTFHEDLVIEAQRLLDAIQFIYYQLTETDTPAAAIAENIKLAAAEMERLKELGIDIQIPFEHVKVVTEAISKKMVFLVATVSSFTDTFLRAAIEGQLQFGKLMEQLIKDLILAIAKAAILSSMFGGLPGVGGFGKGFVKLLTGGLFQKGGIVPGVSTGRDTTIIGAEPGELVVPRDLTALLVRALSRPPTSFGFTFQGIMGMEEFMSQLNILVERQGFRLVASEVAGG